MKQKYSVVVEDLNITLGTGSLAKQANGAVSIQLGETVVFVTAVAAEKVQPEQSYFPLMVDYREKYSAAGVFPGGYFKREGRPTEKEVLTSRLCDRPLRPLFPEGFMNEVQIIGSLLATDKINDPDILMVNAASAALMCSDIPFYGPIGCVRVGDIEGEFVVNPTNEQLFDSRLDLIYVGNENDMMMIEGSADQLPEDRFIEALEFAQEQIQKIIKAQKELAAMVGVTKREYPLFLVKEEVLKICREVVGGRLLEALYNPKKQERKAAVGVLEEEVKEAVKGRLGEDAYEEVEVMRAMERLKEETVRGEMLDRKRRLDGRGEKDLRNINANVGVLPRVHGSAVFERGETQALVVATLGTTKDAQELDALTGGAESKSFILHYNFPPYSVGETGRMGTTGRREIGHGALAERSLLPVVPPEDEFPYSVRLVSDIMESNGSSSMASVCGGCLALMDAGVPILAPVAGISVGLVTNYNSNGRIDKHMLLTDILGDEDHYGDMDFKIAGTREGITGFQLDLKIKGLPLSIAKDAINQNREARELILGKMEAVMDKPRAEIREHAPRIHQMQIDPEKIGLLIGPGGKNIKRITETTGTQIDINEDNSGRLIIYSSNGESLRRAIDEVNIVVGDIEVGMTYKGVVRSIKEFGAFVECIPGKEGLVHVSELSDTHVERVEDVCRLGEELVVKCIGVDDKGRVRLSRKAAIFESQGIPYTPSNPTGGRSRSDGRDGRRGGDRRDGGRRDGGRGRSEGRDGGRRSSR